MKDLKDFLTESLINEGWDRSKTFVEACPKYFKGDKDYFEQAAKIIYGWYASEDAFEDFKNMKDFMKYVLDEKDIMSMIDAGGSGEELTVVGKAIGGDLGEEILEIAKERK